MINIISEKLYGQYVLIEIVVFQIMILKFRLIIKLKIKRMS